MGSKQLLEAVTYVVNQKKHHQQGTIILAMERCDEEDDGPAPWNNGEAIAGIKVIGGSSADFE